jgi:Transposase IS66 family
MITTAATCPQWVSCDTLTLWSRLIRFLEYPQLELSNNLAENPMCPVALGRNYEQSGIMQSTTRANRDFGRWVLGMVEGVTAPS